MTFMNSVQFSSVQSLSHVQLFATPWIAARQASLSITNSRSSLRLTSIESVMPSSHLILCRPLLLLPPIPSCIRVFSNELTLRMRWPKYWSFSFSIIPSKEIPGLISFRMDWLDLLAVQGTLKSLLQHHSSKASVLWHSAYLWNMSIASKQGIPLVVLWLRFHASNAGGKDSIPGQGTKIPQAVWHGQKKKAEIKKKKRITLKKKESICLNIDKKYLKIMHKVLKTFRKW